MTLVLALLAGLLLATGTTRGIDLTVDAARGGACSVHGEFVVHASPEVAWAVLSDYEHIPRFVHSMLSSKVERTADGRIVVEQEAEGHMFVFHRRVMVQLEVREQPRQWIEFHDVLGKDFHYYVGGWDVSPDSAGTRVAYRLEANPKVAMPGSMRRGVLRRSAQDLLEEVRAEMLRR
jgi:ribosome-associated toxin RatA of RatAB toxin-antitoxin module